MIATEKYGLMDDVHPEVAQRFGAEALNPILDMDCGEGRFINAAQTYDLHAIALDQSETMLAAVSTPRTNGDARRLPFHDGCCGGVAALWMLYHLPVPRDAIAEAYRVLRSGGIFIACAPSRYHDPELSEVLPSSHLATFDAENGPELVGELFNDLVVIRWDDPLVHLPAQQALKLYLKGRGLSDAEIAEADGIVSLPLTLTKRGALMTGRKAN